MQPLTHPATAGRRIAIAADAVILGDVKIGEGSIICSGVKIISCGNPIHIGPGTAVLENAVIKSTPNHPVNIGADNLIYAHTLLVGCQTGDRCMIAAHASVFHGAILEDEVEVRANALVHTITKVSTGTTVPVGWVAVGNPAQIFPPNEHEQIWEIQRKLNFPWSAYRVDRETAEGPVLISIIDKIREEFLACEASDGRASE